MRDPACGPRQPAHTGAALCGPTCRLPAHGGLAPPARALGPLGLVPLPSKWLLEFGEPIRTDAYDEHEAEDPMLVFNVTDQVRESIQRWLVER